MFQCRKLNVVEYYRKSSPVAQWLIFAEGATKNKHRIISSSTKYIIFITLNSTDKQNNLEILSLWILPIVTTLVKYKINVSQLTMIVVCRSKCICLLSHRLIVAGTGTQWCSGGGATGAIAPVPIFRVERRSSSCFICFWSILIISYILLKLLLVNCT